MRKTIVLLLLIATMDMIEAGILLDSHGYNEEGNDDADDVLEEEEGIDTEDRNAVATNAEGETADEEPGSPLDETPDEEWLKTAVQDIAFYLRAHKFSDFDRRYHKNEDTAPRTFFKQFPDPPLRSVHWEVRKYCEIDFTDCVQYLHEKVLEAQLRRNVDTATISRKNKWRLPNNTQQIEQADRECHRLWRLDWVSAQPFMGPLERFQWRTSASYYMCWYTMNEERSLAVLGEPCDNFANCLDPEFGDSNGDPRADDDTPFRCATYSFCPDPCCPRKHYGGLQECWHAEGNPCHAAAPSRHRECEFNRSDNRDFVSIALNRWNVSCACQHDGYEWDSRFGMCVDVDECVRGLHSCRQDSEACFNVAGSYRCGCQWGYLFETETQECVQNEELTAVETELYRPETATEKGKPASIVKLIAEHLFDKSVQNGGRLAHSTVMKINIIVLTHLTVMFNYLM